MAARWRVLIERSAELRRKVWVLSEQARTSREQAEARLDESATICELGILMVARVDGKSPAEYLDEHSQTLARALGRSLLLRPPTTVLQAIERVEVGAP
jgi:N-acetylmuramic acid 6-phosphate (MurNAc-6-P) etherase